MTEVNDDQEIPPEFYELADKFINLANKLSRKHEIWSISSSMMYATSRYNAFNASCQDPDISSNRDRLIDYFCNEYREMLIENLDDHTSEHSFGEET